MAGSEVRVDAAALHRRARATVTAAEQALAGVGGTAPDPAEQRLLAERLRAAAEQLAPGWLGSTLDGRQLPLGGPAPRFVRVGTAQPESGARFPAIVPMIGAGNLTTDTDARDPRVAGLLRSVLLRLLAAAPAGSLLVRAVDGTGGGLVFAPFLPLADAGLLAPPATDRAGLRAVLSEGEQWVRPARPLAVRHSRRERTLLLVIASLPEMTEGSDLVRIAALAQRGPDANLHVVVAGWPPPPVTAETVQAPLPRTTMVAVKNPHAFVSDPPGARFTADAAEAAPTGWLNAPVFLDEDPPESLIGWVCEELAAQSAVAARVTLSDVLPDPAEELWSADAAAGLTTTVGHDGDTPVTLRFNDLTPHWMIGGRSGAGKTAFLTNVLYGLGCRYGPDEMALYLLDFKEGVSFTDFVPTRRDRTWLPHARAVGVESDREYGIAVLRELDAEMTRRSVAYKRAGVAKFADLRAAAAEEGRPHRLPRILCVIDEFQVLLAGTDPLAIEAVSLLESLARKGRSYGIHLVLASQTVMGVEALYTKRDSIFGQFPVRVALPGGGDVLEPTNDSAAGLALGTAVVNTAGGLGGPRGATRGHERVVQFPDPHADRGELLALRHKLWQARDEDAAAPRVFAGYAHQHLDDDPTYRAALAGRSARPAALIGRTIDVNLTTAAFPFDSTPGRHLAVFGSHGIGAEVLHAAVRGLAAHHPPRSATFVISSLVAEGDELAKQLAVEIGHRQEVRLVEAGELADEFDPEQAAYRVVFGMDAGRVPTDRLRRLLREGPANGAHLLAWWRGTRRFTEEVGGSAAREDVAGMVFLNVPGPDVNLLLGRPVDWHPRANRALLHDRHADRSSVIVPFVRPEHDE